MMRQPAHHSLCQRGSVLPVVLVMAAGLAAMLSSFLGRTLMEQNRISSRAALERAAWRARGQLELAKNVINASTYTGSTNDVLAASIAAVPPFVPGTGVMVEQVGPNRWYRLTAVAEYGGQLGTVMAFLRDGTSYVIYNYYVEQDGLGVTGQPHGRIHSNKRLEFYFGGGRYDGFVSSGEGFEFQHGATPENTTFDGGTDRQAEAKSLLEAIDFEALEQEASYVAPEGLDARLRFNGDQVEISLFEKPVDMEVPQTRTRQNFMGSSLLEVQKTVYRKEYQWVDVKMSRKNWVEDGDLGHWETEYYYEKEYRQVDVPDGTVMEWTWVPQYSEEVYTVMTTQSVPGALVSTQTLPASGILYFKDDILGVEGDLRGHVTVVDESSIHLTGSLRYVDENGEPAFLNGDDPTQEYVHNPDFIRDHSLGIVAKGDILYAKEVPENFEINASLISTEGLVGFEGIGLDTFGQPYLEGSAQMKTSLRRFGAIMSARRPVSTLLNDDGQVQHGFQQGSSMYDREMIFTPPPGYANEEKILYLTAFRVDTANVTSPGTGVWQTGVNPVGGALDLPHIRTVSEGSRHDWGIVDRNAVLVGPATVTLDGSGSGSLLKIDNKTSAEKSILTK